MLGDYQLITPLLPEVEYPMELSVMFIWKPNLMFLASPWLEIIDFQTSHFAGSEQLKVDICFANFGQVNTDPIQTFFIDFRHVTVILLNLGKACCKKTIQILLKKIQEPWHKIWHKSFSMIHLVGVNNWFL